MRSPGTVPKITLVRRSSGGALRSMEGWVAVPANVIEAASPGDEAELAT